MQKVCIYDETGKISWIIEHMDFWSVQNDFTLLCSVQYHSHLREILFLEKPDCIIFVLGQAVQEQEQLLNMSKLKKEFAGIHIIVIGNSGQYETVRQFFLQGAYDYLLQPLNIQMLEETLLTVSESKKSDYVVNVLSEPIEKMIQHLLSGGGSEESFVEDILLTLQADYKAPHEFSDMADQVKNRVYERVITEKNWLRNLLYESDYDYQVGIGLKNRKMIFDEWCEVFKRISQIVKKYQYIENSLVSRIGSYVVQHTDDKLSLDKVAEGVYLNPSYISAIFKKTTGINFTDFVAEVKIDRAKILLRNPNVKIHDVASKIAYQNVEYFTKTFKKKTGLTPVEYQRNYKMVR